MVLLQGSREPIRADSIGFRVVHLAGHDQGTTALVAKRDIVVPRDAIQSVGLRPRQPTAESKSYTIPASATHNLTSGVHADQEIKVRLTGYKDDINEDVVWSSAWQAIQWHASQTPRHPSSTGSFAFKSETLIDIVVVPLQGSLSYDAVRVALTILPFAMLGEDQFKECNFAVEQGGRDIASGRIGNAPTGQDVVDVLR